MNTPRLSSSAITVIAFTLACALGAGWLWVKAGGTIPVVASAPDYRVTFVTDDVKNLRGTGEVRVAGVEIGRVESTEVVDGNKVRVEISLDEPAAPLHEGATVRVGVKSLVGSSYVDVKDGDGQEISNGSELDAKDAVIPAVDVDELLETLDPQTRDSLSTLVRSLGRATKGTSEHIDGLATGVGNLGREGYTVIDALATQSEDLTALTAEARRLIDALDTGRGQIATLVSSAQTLTEATAGKREAVEYLVRELPGLLRNVRGGAVSLQALAGPLEPILASLQKAAPDLSEALLNLPATTADLNGLLPHLDATLDALPATLKHVPDFTTNVIDLVPDAHLLLRDVNPMLAYLAPYGMDVGAMFASFGASFDTLTADGVRPIRLTATGEGLQSVKGGTPSAKGTGLWHVNPYPAPLSADQPRDYTGSYPRVERDPK